MSAHASITFTVRLCSKRVAFSPFFDNLRLVWSPLESLTDDEDNHFTREDVKDALKALKADNKLLSTMASREWIEKQTKVVIPPNKRNGRKQATHLKIARFTLETMNEDRGKALQGRPDKAKIVEEWRESHPLGTKADCERDTGMSRHTVLKWWSVGEAL
jgi:hypothetical protein